MPELIFKNTDKLNLNNPKHSKQFEQAIQCFMGRPFGHLPEAVLKTEEGKKQHKKLQEFISKKKKLMSLQEFSTSGDFQQSWTEIMKTIETEDATDVGYESFFDIGDFTNKKVSSYNVYNVTHGITFEKIIEGDEVRFFGISGTKYAVTFDTYGSGLAISQNLIDDGDY